MTADTASLNFSNDSEKNGNENFGELFNCAVFAVGIKVLDTRNSPKSSSDFLSMSAYSLRKFWRFSV